MWTTTWRPLGIVRSLPGILDTKINDPSLITEVTHIMKINGSEKFNASRVVEFRRRLFSLKEILKKLKLSQCNLLCVISFVIFKGSFTLRRQRQINSKNFVFRCCHNVNTTVCYFDTHSFCCCHDWVQNPFNDDTKIMKNMPCERALRTVSCLIFHGIGYVRMFI